eukprot:1932362-Rhodomonas_salina.4
MTQTKRSRALAALDCLRDRLSINVHFFIILLTWSTQLDDSLLSQPLTSQQSLRRPGSASVPHLRISLESHPISIAHPVVVGGLACVSFAGRRSWGRCAGAAALLVLALLLSLLVAASHVKPGHEARSRAGVRGGYLVGSHEAAHPHLKLLQVDVLVLILRSTKHTRSSESARRSTAQTITGMASEFKESGCGGSALCRRSRIALPPPRATLPAPAPPLPARSLLCETRPQKQVKAELDEDCVTRCFSCEHQYCTIHTISKRCHEIAPRHCVWNLPAQVAVEVFVPEQKLLFNLCGELCQAIALSCLLSVSAIWFIALEGSST